MTIEAIDQYAKIAWHLSDAAAPTILLCAIVIGVCAVAIQIIKDIWPH